MFPQKRLDNSQFDTKTQVQHVNPSAASRKRKCPATDSCGNKSSSSIACTPVAPENKRNRHRNVEKERRRRMNESIKQIQNLCQVGQVEKATILLEAVKKLKDNREKLVPTEVENLRQENQALRMELEYLQKSAKRRKVEDKPSEEAKDGDVEMQIVKRQSEAHRLSPTALGLQIDLKSVFANNGCGVCLATMDCQIRDMNIQFAKIIRLKYQYARTSNLSGMTLTPSVDYPLLFGVLMRLKQGGMQMQTMKKRMYDMFGNVFMVRTTLMVIQDDNGKPKALLATCERLDEEPPPLLQNSIELVTSPNTNTSPNTSAASPVSPTSSSDATAPMST